jgi:hypothetical protein
MEQGAGMGSEVTRPSPRATGNGNAPVLGAVEETVRSTAQRRSRDSKASASKAGTTTLWSLSNEPDTITLPRPDSRFLIIGYARAPYT